MTAIVPINKAEFVQVNSVEKSKAALAKESELNRSATNQTVANKNDINSEHVRVSTSLGRSDIRGNLSHTEAIKIYENIAKLI